MHFVPNPLIIPIGFLIGVLVAAPVGPVNVLCIQRAIERGALAGITAGLGAVLGDGLIALAASLGVGAISGAFSDYRYFIQVVGGLALIAFGTKLFLAAPRLDSPRTNDLGWSEFRNVLWDVPKTFFLTVTNPGAVLGLVAIFGGVSSFVEVHSTVDALTMVAAIMGGSFAWWVCLSLMVGRIRHRVDLQRVRQINMVAGALLVCFGVLLVGEIALKSARVI
jgi:threonine/homoserine/homoserine lactone efflux protein